MSRTTEPRQLTDLERLVYIDQLTEERRMIVAGEQPLLFTPNPIKEQNVE